MKILILFFVVLQFRLAAWASEDCSVHEEATRYAAILGCSKGKSSACLTASAIGVGAVSEKLRSSSGKNSTVSKLNSIYSDAKKLYAEELDRSSKLRERAYQYLQRMDPFDLYNQAVNVEGGITDVDKALSKHLSTPNSQATVKLREGWLSIRNSEGLDVQDLNKAKVMETLKQKYGSEIFEKNGLGGQIHDLAQRMAESEHEARKFQSGSRISSVFAQASNHASDRASRDQFEKTAGYFASEEARASADLARGVRPDVAKRLVRMRNLSSSIDRSISSGRGQLGLMALAGGVGIAVTTATSNQAMARCSGAFNLTSKEASELAPYLEQVSINDTNNCDSLKLSMSKIEQNLDSGTALPNGLCKMLENRNKVYEAQDVDLVPTFNGNCESSKMLQGGKELAVLSQTSDGFELSMPRSDGGSIKVPYRNVGGLDFDMSKSNCTRTGDQRDPACTTFIRNLYPEMMGSYTPQLGWSSLLSQTASTCDYKGGYQTEIRKDLCPFTRSANLIRAATAIRHDDCLQNGAAKGTSSENRGVK